MQVLHERFADDPTVTVLAVHFDDRDDPVAYLQEHGYTYPSIPSGGEVAKEFGVNLLPTFLVVNGNGTVIHKHTGRLTDAARDEIASIATNAQRSAPS